MDIKLFKETQMIQRKMQIKYGSKICTIEVDSGTRVAQWCCFLTDTPWISSKLYSCTQNVCIFMKLFAYININKPHYTLV